MVSLASRLLLVILSHYNMINMDTYISQYVSILYLLQDVNKESGECNHGPSFRVCTPARGVTTPREQLNNRIYTHHIMVIVMSSFSREGHFMLNAYIRRQRSFWTKMGKRKSKTNKLFSKPRNITQTNKIGMRKCAALYHRWSWVERIKSSLF